MSFKTRSLAKSVLPIGLRSNAMKFGSANLPRSTASLLNTTVVRGIASRPASTPITSSLIGRNFSVSHKPSPKSILDRAGDQIAERASQSIAAEIKAAATTPEQVAHIHESMKKCLQRLRLMDAEGQIIPELKDQAKRLMPPTLTSEEINSFIEEVRSVNLQNGFFKNFLAKMGNSSTRDLLLGGSRFQYFVQQVRSDWFKNEVLPEVIAFAMTLENVTKLMGESIDIVEVMVTRWESESKRVNMLSYTSLPYRVKFESILKPIKDFQYCVRKGSIRGNFGSFMLPLNILEAKAYDLFRGNFANAHAGWILAKHRPGNIIDAGTDACPTRLAKGKPLVETGLGLPEMWNDGYQFWNCVFGMQFSTAPFYATKLLIPTVAGYHPEPGSGSLEKPRQYLNNRVNALMAYLFASGFAAVDTAAGAKEWYGRRDWPVNLFVDSGILELAGQESRRSMLEYEKEYAARTTRKGWFS